MDEEVISVLLVSFSLLQITLYIRFTELYRDLYENGVAEKKEIWKQAHLCALSIERKTDWNHPRTLKTSPSAARQDCFFTA